MKKTLAAALCLLLWVSLATPALAAPDRDLSQETALASQLKELGLFLGVGEGADGTADFALDRAPNRTEAVVMLVRALGRETEADAASKTHPFTDVPAWADGYVSYAYDHGLTMGVSENLFGANDPVTVQMYLTFLLRALGYTEGKYEDFVWNTPEALAYWCGMLPLQVDRDDFLRADVVTVTSAALFATLRGGETTLYETLIAEDCFTNAQFEAAFPEHPFARDQKISQQITAAIASYTTLGKLNEHTYATESHYITDCWEENGVLTLAVLICYGDTELRYDEYAENGTYVSGGGGSVAAWQFKLDAKTLDLISYRTAAEFREEGLTFTDWASEQSQAVLDVLRFPLRDVCLLQIQIQVDMGLLAYRQLSYEETLEKVKTGYAEITQTIESTYCTILLGKGAYDYYDLILVYKPGHGEGDFQIVSGGSKGEVWLSEDERTVFYSYHVDNYLGPGGLPPNAYVNRTPESGTVLHTIELFGSTTMQFFSDEERSD